MGVVLINHPTSKSQKKNYRISFVEAMDAILDENRNLINQVAENSVENFINSIQKATSVFFSAQGRSGFILRCFCMRLMHLGYSVYFCGETITPAVTENDLLIVLSGSGQTPSTLAAVNTAKQCGTQTYGILGNIASGIGSLVDQSLYLPGTTKLCRDGEPKSVQMAGSLFEQSAFLFLEAVILKLYQTRKKDVGSVSTRHAVIE